MRKKGITRRLFSVVLAVMMLASLVPIHDVMAYVLIVTYDFKLTTNGQTVDWDSECTNYETAAEQSAKAGDSIAIVTNNLGSVNITLSGGPDSWNCNVNVNHNVTYDIPTGYKVKDISFGSDPQLTFTCELEQEQDSSTSTHTPGNTPSKSEATVVKVTTIPTDYVAERVAEEEAMAVSPVTIDTTQYGKNEETAVPGTSYNLSKFVTTTGIVKGIKTAVAAANNNKNDVAEIYTGKPFCFNKEIIKAIQEGNKTVVYYFQYKGHIYSVTIPASVDPTKVLEKSGFAGPLYVGEMLGTTRLVK